MPNITDDDEDTDRDPRRRNLEHQRQKSGNAPVSLNDSIIASALERAMPRMLESIGLDITTPTERAAIRDDMAWVRRQRESQESRQGQVVSKIISALVGVITALVISACGWIVAHWPHT